MTDKLEREAMQREVDVYFSGLSLPEAIRKAKANTRFFFWGSIISSKLEEIAKAEGYQTEIIGATTISRLGGSSVPYTAFTFVVSKDSHRFEVYRNKTVTGFVAGRVSANLRKIFIKLI